MECLVLFVSYLWEDFKNFSMGFEIVIDVLEGERGEKSKKSI